MGGLQQLSEARKKAGLRHRPALPQAEAVGYELSLQVMLHPQLMGDIFHSVEMAAEHEVPTSVALQTSVS